MASMAMEVALIVVLVLLNGLLAMSEIALVSARKGRLETLAARGDQGAAVALELMGQPGRFLSAVQIGITLVGIAAGAFGGAKLSVHVQTALEGFPLTAPYAVPLSFAAVVVVITLLSLVVGELAPKQIALANPERVAATTAPAMATVARLASPLVSLLAYLTTLLLRLLRVSPTTEAGVTPDEVQQMIRLGVQEGVFGSAQQVVMERAIELGGRRLGSLMTSRTEVVWLDLDQPAEALIKQVHDAPHARFPAAHGSLDRVIGTVNASDLVAAAWGSGSVDIGGLVRPAVFLPEGLGAFAALERLGQSGQPIGIVIGEHGGVEGLVTVTDFTAALVGFLAPLMADGQPEIVARGDGSWLVDGALSAGALKGLMRLDVLPDEGAYDTVSGLVMALAGRMPATGDRFQVGAWDLEVVDMDGWRVDKVLVQARPGSSAVPLTG